MSASSMIARTLVEQSKRSKTTASPAMPSILSPDKQATQDIADDTGAHAGAGAATGAVAGGILGGLGGWLVGIGALVIPGIGPFIAGVPWMLPATRMPPAMVNSANSRMMKDKYSSSSVCRKRNAE